MPCAPALRPCAGAAFPTAAVAAAAKPTPHHAVRMWTPDPLQGQLAVFGSQLAHSAPAAAAACRAAAAALRPRIREVTTTTTTTTSDSKGGAASPLKGIPLPDQAPLTPNPHCAVSVPGGTHTVTLSACYTYVVPPPCVHAGGADSASRRARLLGGDSESDSESEEGGSLGAGRAEVQGPSCVHSGSAAGRGAGLDGWREYDALGVPLGEDQEGRRRRLRRRRHSSSSSSRSSGSGGSGRKSKSSREGGGWPGSGIDEGGGSVAWDRGAPWQPWARQLDPIASIEMDVAWQDLVLGQEKQGLRELLQGQAQAQPQGLPRGEGPLEAACAPIGPAGDDPFAGLLRPSSTQQWMLHVSVRDRLDCGCG